MKCSCPTQYDERTGDIVRAGTDQLCPVHGRMDVAGRCKACGAPIVQTPEVAKAQAERKGRQP